MVAHTEQMHEASSKTEQTGPGLGLIDDLLRNRKAVMERLADPEMGAQAARALLLTICVGMGVLGATLGMYRGGLQILYAGIKLPLLAVLTAALTAPALSAMRVALYGTTRPRQDAMTVLAALGLTSLLAAAMAPVVLLFMSLDASYHGLFLVVVLCLGLSGLGGLVFFGSALAREPRSGAGLVFVVVCAVCLAVGSQLGWTLRPWLVRPRAPQVVFVRSVEGSLLEAVSESIDSARGRYRRAYAPLPGEPEAPGDDFSEVMRDVRQAPPSPASVSPTSVSPTSASPTSASPTPVSPGGASPELLSPASRSRGWRASEASR